MIPEFDQDIFYGRLVNGALRPAMDYLRQFPQQMERYQKYVSLFQEERDPPCDAAPELCEILRLYQKYYREAFYLELPAGDAAERLRRRLADLLQAEAAAPLDVLEETAAEVFRRRSFHVLTGRTGGYYGPYIWKTQELASYTVELPEGTREYAVMLLDGFLSKGWLDYISLGAVSTGGWCNGDGLLHCVRSSYDLDSENFQVSLLKHEAQHGADLERYPDMFPQDLEYRAKLVELIYSSRRPLLERFLGEADAAGSDSGHGLASARIARDFQNCMHSSPGQLAALPIWEVQAAARALFAESSGEMEKKYRSFPIPT